MALTKAEIALHLSEKNGLTKRQAKEFVESFFEVGVAQSSLQIRKIISWLLFLDLPKFIIITNSLPSLILIITFRLATHSPYSIRLLF